MTSSDQAREAAKPLHQSDEFSVFEFYPDGTYTRVAHYVSAKEAVATAHTCTRKPAVLLGIITKVMITDGSDFCVFLWEYEKGVVFPTGAKHEEIQE